MESNIYGSGSRIIRLIDITSGEFLAQRLGQKVAQLSDQGSNIDWVVLSFSSKNEGSTHRLHLGREDIKMLELVTVCIEAWKEEGTAKGVV